MCFLILCDVQRLLTFQEKANYCWFLTFFHLFELIFRVYLSSINTFKWKIWFKKEVKAPILPSIFSFASPHSHPPSPILFFNSSPSCCCCCCCCCCCWVILEPAGFAPCIVSPDLLVRCTSDPWCNTHTHLCEMDLHSFSSGVQGLQFIGSKGPHKDWSIMSSSLCFILKLIQFTTSLVLMFYIYTQSWKQPTTAIFLKCTWTVLTRSHTHTHAHTHTRTHTLLLRQPSSRFLLPTPSLSIAVFPPTSTMSDSMATCGAFPYTCVGSVSVCLSAQLCRDLHFHSRPTCFKVCL